MKDQNKNSVLITQQVTSNTEITDTNSTSTDSLEKEAVNSTSNKSTSKTVSSTIDMSVNPINKESVKDFFFKDAFLEGFIWE